MKRITYAMLGLMLASLPVPASASPPTAPADARAPSRVLSRGEKATLTAHLTEARPTVFVFYKKSSSLERNWVEQVRKDAGENVGIGLIELKTGTEPITQQYAISDTPTAIVYDRRERLVTRSSEPDAIRSAIKKASGVMRIDWAGDDDPRLAESARLLGRSPGVGILRTMTQQPEYLKLIGDLSNKAHFSDGYLKRRTKEMIATYVSTLNHCKY